MSTQEIVACVGDLVRIAKQYQDRIDVGYAIANCVMTSSNMMRCYNTDGYDQTELEILKRNCSASYIRLEYALAFLPQQHKDYTARIKIYQMYSNTKKVKLRNLSPDDKLKFIELCSRINSLRKSSLDCRFNYSESELYDIEHKLEVYLNE